MRLVGAARYDRGLRTAILRIACFALGFVAVYAAAMVLAFAGLPTIASLPYEQLLGWMVLGGAVAAVLPQALRRSRS